jgi:hypothetical protein
MSSTTGLRHQQALDPKFESISCFVLTTTQTYHWMYLVE